MPHSAAIMQPYLFPYIGYYQLVNAVDTFVFYDDVNFIKRGWINRNNILVKGEPKKFTVPLVKASQNKLINEIRLADDLKWKDNFFKTLRLNYGKAPYYKEVAEIVEAVFSQEHENIAQLASESIKRVGDYLGFDTRYLRSSELEYDRSLKGQGRILAVCEQLEVLHYINPINGRELYDRDRFLKEGREMHFIKAGEIKYQQFEGEDFVPYLSMIDVLMFNSKDYICKLLKQYELVEN